MSSAFHNAMVFAAKRESITKQHVIPPRPSQPPLPNIQFTTLAPLHSVHRLIFVYLEELCPTLLLRISPSFHKKILPKLYTRVVLNSNNAPGFFHGVTDGPDGRKAKSLQLVKTLIFSDPEAMESIMREVYQPPIPRGLDTFWRTRLDITYPLFPHTTNVQIGWPILRFFLTPPHHIDGFPDDSREGLAPSGGLSAMMIYAMSFSRMLEDQVPEMKELCVDLESGETYDGISVEQVFRTIAYRGRRQWVNSIQRRSPGKVFDFTLLIRVHLQSQQTPVYLPAKTPAPFVIRFMPHADPSKRLPVDPKVTAYAIYNLFRIHTSRDSVPAVFEVIEEQSVRRELEKLIEDLGMRRDTTTWDYFWKSFELREKSEEEDNWEPPAFD
ncbi:hypothetical protein CNBJ0320 [Cryptococcus gattii WM276]|uniref:Uncharacterized protein n=2 Tax=Cryptococcus gattii TaxID=37769 RepID=E6RCK1_CRYGW|nr:uncharacterized protein CGB_J0260W [Cryptococcus gattii WM276]ADV24553.1 hypothetical protein CNBJ0320 [Cryptococcus gattii WM276]KIR80301.1 hypothetical protein I306_02641 [Cryptococcus gattii EJB2]